MFNNMYLHIKYQIFKVWLTLQHIIDWVYIMEIMLINDQYKYMNHETWTGTSNKIKLQSILYVVFE